MAHNDLRKELLDEFLTCGICFETFTKPKSLPCRHTFCMDCLNKHVASEQNQNAQRRPGDGQGRPRGRQAAFDCPKCRKHVHLSPRGVEGLPDDHTMISLTDTVLKDVLKDGKGTKEEVRPQVQVVDRCPKHPGEELRMFCNRCGVPVCAECVEIEHDGHSTSGIKKMLGLTKDNITPLLRQGKWKRDELGGHLKGLQYAEYRLQASKEAATADVHELGRTLKSEIDAIVANILGELESRYVSQLEVLTQEKDSVSRKLADLSQIILGVEEEVHTSTPSRIVAKEQEMVEQLKEVVSQEVPVQEFVVTLAFQANRTKLSDLSFGVVTEAGESVDRKSFTKRVLGKVGEEGNMKYPGGVTAWREEVYVVDRGNKQIRVFDCYGNRRRTFPTDVFGNGSEPQDIVVTVFEDEDRVLVTDKCEGGLRVFDKYGTRVDRVGNICLGPMGLTVSKHNNTLLVVDEDRNCVSMCPEMDGRGPATNYAYSFNHPFGITTSMKGKIFISDCQNHCIKVLSSNGEHLHTFGSEGGGEGQLRHPLGVHCDDQGRILVADSGNKRVEVFSEEGEFLCHAVTAEDGLDCPVGIALLQVMQDHILVVTDTKSHKLLFVRYDL